MVRKHFWIACIVFGASFNAFAVESTPPQTGIVEKLGSYLPMDVQLVDESGNLVKLGSVLNKPTILAFVYYECPGICTPLLNDVADVVNKMNLEPGKDYQILTVSFDTRETPEMAISKQENYLAEVKKPIAPSAWRFFTGDSANVRRLTDAAGFYYMRQRNDWVHPTALIAVSPKGEITRYLYGVNQLPMDVKLAIMEASAGKTGPTIAKVLNFCFAYDPVGKHYAFDFVRVGGALMLGLTGLFLYVFIVKPKLARKGAPR